MDEGEFRRKLTPQQYEIMRNRGTEPPFSGKLLYNKEKGAYSCAACGAGLFPSDSKFESGTGWPSFSSATENVGKRKDASLGIERTEVFCKKCGGHLGHVFDDGPRPSGKRYCINSAALDFKSGYAKIEKAAFAAGCFWHVQEGFDKLEGVIRTTAGFMGGTAKNPSYEQVCKGNTGHAEAVLVEFDPEKTSYEKLLAAFWAMHDPTQADRQGPDVGKQYRSAIFYYGAAQKTAAGKSLEAEQDRRGVRIATQIAAAGEFYPAEEYHQKYYAKKGCCGP